MTSTATRTPLAQQFPCPTGCRHADNYLGHEVDFHDGERIALHHETHFGPYVCGVVVQDVATGEAFDVRVLVLDVENEVHAPRTPAALRDLARELEAAADWLYAHG